MGPVPIIGHGGESVVTKALTDRVEASGGKRSSRAGNINFTVITKDVDGFKASQSQITAKAHHAQEVAARRNR